jgi:hypothetical protein
MRREPDGSDPLPATKNTKKQIKLLVLIFFYSLRSLRSNTIFTRKKNKRFSSALALFICNTIKMAPLYEWSANQLQNAAFAL